MSIERIYKDFDLPTKHLTGDAHFVPRKARDEEEIARRHELAHGTIILEHQRLGLGVASLAIKLAKSPDDIDFITSVLAASGINTAWYAFARGAEAEVQRRRLKLPDLTALKPENRPSSEDLRDEAAWLFGEAMQRTDAVISALQTDRKKFISLSKTVGRMTGKASLTLAAAGAGDHIIEVGGMSQFDTQNLVRQRSLVALDTARTMDEALCVPPSLAQLADPLSNVSVYWQRQAPNGAMNALEQAWDIRGVAA